MPTGPFARVASLRSCDRGDLPLEPPVTDHKRLPSTVGMLRIVAIVTLSGCSSATVRGNLDSRRPRGQQCATRGAPVVDLLAAAVGIAAAITFGRGCTQACESGTEGSPDVGDRMVQGIALGATALFGVSGAYGFGAIGTCENALEKKSHPVDQQARRAAPNRTNDPKNANAFWCDVDGTCFTASAACAAECKSRERAWCAPISGRFVCGADRRRCVLIVAESRELSDGECIERRAEMWTRQQSAATESAPETSMPRGFVCAQSRKQPAADTCAREKRDCDAARDAAIAAVSDLGECSVVETAHCFDNNEREQRRTNNAPHTAVGSLATNAVESAHPARERRRPGGCGASEPKRKRGRRSSLLRGDKGDRTRPEHDD